VSGKFQDHYVILGVEPSADSETIQTAYAKLAQKYAETGEKNKFDAVNQAYEVLADPALRASFDKVKGVDLEAGNPKFSGAEFFRGLAQGSGLRSAVLCILYDRRRVKSSKPGLSMRHLEGMMNTTSDELNFALWYLKKRGFIAIDDKSSMEISVEGMDFLEQNRPSAEGVMQFIKQDSLVNTQQPAAATKIEESILNVLNRTLHRASAPQVK
jgi:curved DNA-binding protein CbpA